MIGPNGAALCAAPCGRPLQRARPARPRRACPPALRTRAPPKRPARTKGALQPTSQHVRTPITVPRTPQACSMILHDHRPDARAHKTPAQRPHPRAAMRASRSPRARHTQNVQRLPGALQQQVLLVLEHLHVEKSGLRRRGRAHRREQVRRRRRARTSRSAGSARPAISRVQRAASNSVTRETHHVPKPATFHTHTDHTLLLTPTDYVTRFGIYSYRYTHSTAPAGYPTASAGFQASAAHSASAGQHLSPTQQLRYAPIPATKS